MGVAAVMSAAVRPLIARAIDQDDNLPVEVRHAINVQWEAQNEMYAVIARRGFQGHYNCQLDRAKAFFTAEEIEAGEGVCECCSDEGNCHYCKQGARHDMLLVRIPGSGILRALDTESKDPFDPDFILSTARDALTANVTVFTSHEECSAFENVYNNWLTLHEQSKVGKKILDVKSQEWAQAVVQAMKKLAPSRADTISADFITSDKMDRPEHMHIARCLYLTDLDSFNAAYKGLPRGFVERTGREENLQHVLQHADVLRQIAFNTKAFGTKFTEKPAEQFVICCVTDSPERLKVLIAKARNAVNTLEPQIQCKIRVEGLLK